MSFLKTHHHKRLLAFLLTITFSLVFVMICASSIGLQEIENRTWDWRVKLTVKKGSADSNIRIIEVDQTSLENQAKEGFTWPWPRSRYVPIIKFLEAAGARGLAFDLFFTEASVYGEKDDLTFSQSLKSKLPVLNIVGLSKNEREVDEDLFEIFAERLNEIQEKTSYNKLLQGTLAPKFSSVLLPITQILQDSAGFGNASTEPDSDGILRHYTVGGSIKGVPVLNSPFALYNMIAGIADLNLSKFIDESGHLAVHFHEPEGAYSPASADAILQSYFQIQRHETPLVDPESFRGKWVYLGVTAPGLYDLKPTPLNEKSKGVEYLATVLDNIINHDFVIKFKYWQNLILSVFFVLWIACSIFFVSAPAKQINLALALIGLVFSAYFTAKYGYWISVVMIFGGASASLIVSLALQYWLEGNQHKFIREAFRYYVSPSVIEQIVQDPSTLSLGGEKRELSMFFSDIVGFTSISEKLEASKLVILMNKFLTEMTDIIQSHDGTVDKYVGDAIVAFWNAPVAQPNHAYMAVKAALESQKRLAELSKDFQQDFGVDIKMRIGVNTGTVAVGNFGSKDRFSYTMIGDAANLASRLEGANKYFGTKILIGTSTHAALNNRILSRKIATLQVVGKSQNIEVFEPSFESEIGSVALFEQFNQALTAFEDGDLKKSLEYFQTMPQDPVARVYITRLERDIRKGKDGEWSPIWKLTEK